LLTDPQFERARRLASQVAGIELLERHRELLNQRSRRLGLQDDERLEAMLAAAEQGDADATRRLVGWVTTNFTGFFRHPAHFELAAQQSLRAVQRRGQARLWSAAAATGEEPYSLAMALLEVFNRADPSVTILASDLDEEALARAVQGEYGEAALRAVASERRARFFAPTAPGRWGVAPDVRRLVEFRAVNLVGAAWPVEGEFDVIFCRNVLMYLEACHRRAALDHLAGLLGTDGLLILDPTEHLGQAAPLFGPGADGVYTLRRVRL
jgi:chemotaxis protein methyltransferase CheR